MKEPAVLKRLCIAGSGSFPHGAVPCGPVGGADDATGIDKARKRRMGVDTRQRTAGAASEEGAARTNRSTDSAVRRGAETVLPVRPARRVENDRRRVVLGDADGGEKRPPAPGRAACGRSR